MATRGTGFTDIGQYLAANAGTVANERAGLNSLVGGELDNAKNAADAIVAQAQHGDPQYSAMPGYGAAAQQQLEAQADTTNLGDQGGIAGLLGKQYGDTTAQGGFDAGLLGTGGFGATQQKAKSLDGYLDAQLTAATGRVDKPLPPVGSPNMPGTGPDIPQSGSGTPYPANPTTGGAAGGGGGGGTSSPEDKRWKVNN